MINQRNGKLPKRAFAEMDNLQDKKLPKQAITETDSH